jgi:16S rRNA (cytosine1402-N4)-methyltransferase
VAVDCTAGGGGHTEALLATGARVVAIDRDPKAQDALRARFPDAAGLLPVHGDFRDIEAIVEDAAGGPVHAILADLGVSSPQLDEAARGFSFRAAGPLDMRMDPTGGAPLAERLATVDEATLAGVIRDLGEERRARAIARAILRARDEGTLSDTARLADVVARAAGGAARAKGGIHPATRTFQALRIWVNDELGALDALLRALPNVLAPGGRAAIISFHSLEDRKVKRAFADLSRGCVCPPDLPVCRCERVAEFARVTRRAVVASDAETTRNPRARSARLRVVERVRQGAPDPAHNDDTEVHDG